MDIVDDIIHLLAVQDAGVLPKGGAEWLQRHPAQACRLYQDLLDLAPHEFVEWSYAIVGTVWASDDDHAAERLGHALCHYELYPVVRWRWTGRWQIGVADGPATTAGS